MHCLSAGESLALFVGPVPVDKLPKDATAGRSLAGTLQLGLQQGSKQHAPGNFPLTYRLGVAPCWLRCCLHLPSAALHLLNISVTATAAACYLLHLATSAASPPEVVIRADHCAPCAAVLLPRQKAMT